MGLREMVGGAVIPVAVRFPIVMKTWAGSQAHDFDYVSRSIPSLLRSGLPDGADVVIFDDASTDPRMRPFLESIAKADGRVRLVLNETNKGPNRGQADAYEQVTAEYPDAPFFVNVDDDVVYHPGWLQRLIAVREDVVPQGHDGVYSALNMPFRPAHRTLCTSRGTVLLKWKQPALNWLIPREVYDRVGPFEDEGVAYDTVYSHWMRLHGLSVVCLRPSLVQNIGTYGAYSRDDTTTATDFVGDGPLTRFRQGVRRARGWLEGIACPSPYRVLWPIRWGVEWVYEAVARDGAPVAVFRVGEAEQPGAQRDAALGRAAELQRLQGPGPLAIRRIHHGGGGSAFTIECSWRFWPNLRECARLPAIYGRIDSGKVFRAIVEALIPLHRRGFVHNKVRAENLYYDPAEDRFHLAWFGDEVDGRDENTLVEDRRFPWALDRNASAELRRQFAARRLEPVAPEVLEGSAPTLASDVYAAAKLAESVAANVRSETTLERERRRALSRDPSRRPPDATAIGRLLRG